MILIIDNYDSFVHNLARYVRQLANAPVEVVRNDMVSVPDIVEASPAAIVFSPGPCGPDDAGASLAIAEHFLPSIPMLGVCLGHQILVQAMGGQIEASGHPVHGKSGLIQHDGTSPLFAGIPREFQAGRYHSLVAIADRLPDDVAVVARNNQGVVMAIQHSTFPAYGVQFHPESVLTEHGYRLIANFLQIAGIQQSTESHHQIFA